MGVERLRTLVLAGGIAACSAVGAKYPSWEPTTGIVPEVTDRKLALADLEVSRRLWLARAWHEYTYVRARQISQIEVEFTFVVVRDSTVVERALLTSQVDASGLGDRLSGRFGQAPRLQWWEHGHGIGRHDGGAPAFTMDQLYDVCRDQVLSVQQEHLPRLSFHRDGLLQHCGFLSHDCDDCAVVSVQTLSAITPQPWQVPGDMLCTDRYGLFLHGQEPVTSFGCEICSCVATNLSDPNREMEQDGIGGHVRQSGLGDICKIDPAACPRGGIAPGRASWFCKLVLDGDGCVGGLVRDATPECLAFPRPILWSDPAWRHRCRPLP